MLHQISEADENIPKKFFPSIWVLGSTKNAFLARVSQIWIFYSHDQLWAKTAYFEPFLQKLKKLDLFLPGSYLWA